MQAKLLLGAALSLVCALGAGAQKRNITEQDLFNFTWIGDTQISPDGARAVFIQTTVNAKHDGYETALFLLDLTQAQNIPRRLTNGPHDGQPSWSPDGTQIAFIRRPQSDGKAQPPQLFLLPLAGGEPMQVSKLEHGATSPQWAPAGKYIAVLSDTPVKPQTEASPNKKAGGKEDEHKSDVRIITKDEYRYNGAGYLDTRNAAQIYLFPPPQPGQSPAQPWQVTAGRYGVDEIAWDPASSDLYYLSEHIDEPYYDLPRNEIYKLAIGSGGLKEGSLPASALVAKLSFHADSLAISPDGKHLAFHGADQPPKTRSHQQPDMFVLDIDAGQPTPPMHNLTKAYDYEIGDGVGGDNAAPAGGGSSVPRWTPDGRTLIDVVGKHGSALLISLDATSGEVKELSAQKQAVVSSSITPDASKALAVISTPIMVGELFAIPLDGSKQQTQLTHVNDALFSQLNLTMPDDLQVRPTVNPTDIGGQQIETWVQKPPGFDAQKKYPLILDIHGGPHSAYGWVFDHEFQFLAARGYLVVYPNPRGSTTYGQRFANVIQHNYPGDDFHDLMDSVDAVIQLGYVDSGKLGVTGGSGGGLLTDWTVTQTNRFKAAVAQRDITDWANWWYTSDLVFFKPGWFEGTPFEHPEEFKKYSPLTYIANVKTPMMFILGESDYRTPPTAGGEDFFRALKYMHIDTVMVRFPGETHELSRSGQPWHRVERLQNIVNWFDKYLKGLPEPQYDVVPAAAGL